MCLKRKHCSSRPGLVLLIMLLACIGRRYARSSANTTNGATDAKQHEKIQAVYVVPPHPFSEVDEFVETSAEEYRLDVVRYQLPMKKGLECYLDERKSIEAIFVGTRRTDPHGEFLTSFDPTDSGWPPFMRVHPVIDWHYGKSHDFSYRSFWGALSRLRECRFQ